MLMADPTVLRELVEQYETLSSPYTPSVAPEIRQRIEDIAYTLCVSTGTREVQSALAAARRQLAMADGASETPQPV